MKLRFLLLGTIIVTLGVLLTSCQNSNKQKRTIIGELTKSSPISLDFSKFSGTESYEFTISEETTFKSSLTLQVGKILINLVDDAGNEYLTINSSGQNSVVLTPNGETTYYIDMKYDNSMGRYSFELN